MTLMRDLRRHESTIQRGLASFVEVGRALAEIKERGLYKARCETFEQYCQTYWSFSRSYVYRLVQGAEVVGRLLPAGNKSDSDSMPITEWQVRELRKLPANEQAGAWSAATKAAAAEGVPVTSRHVSAVVESRLQPREPGPEKAKVQPAHDSVTVHAPEGVTTLIADPTLPKDVAIPVDEPDEAFTLGGEEPQGEQEVDEATVAPAEPLTPADDTIDSYDAITTERTGGRVLISIPGESVPGRKLAARSNRRGLTAPEWLCEAIISYLGRLKVAAAQPAGHYTLEGMDLPPELVQRAVKRALYMEDAS